VKCSRQEPVLFSWLENLLPKNFRYSAGIKNTSFSCLLFERYCPVGTPVLGLFYFGACKNAMVWKKRKNGKKEILFMH